MNEAKKIGLSINLEKTKYFSNTTAIGDGIKLNGIIEQVNNFTYLGSQIGSTTSDIYARKNKAFALFWTMKKIWLSRAIYLKLKIRIFKMTCLANILNGCAMDYYKTT